MARPYSLIFKREMLDRMRGPAPTSAAQLAKETGVPQPTLSRWLREADTLPVVSGRKRKPKRKRRFGVDDKLRIMKEVAELEEEQRGAYLRREGVHPSQLQSWRKALDESKAADKRLSQRVRQLEQELRRKDKALAEAAALLILKKKVESLLEDEGDDTDEEHES